MSQHHLPSVRVVGIGSYSPGEPIGNEKLEKILDIPVVSTMSYFGVESRFFAVSAETGEPLEPGLSCMELAARSGEAAMQDAGIEAAQVDLLITATSTPDHELPPFPYELQKRLGIKHSMVLDIRGGCVASLQGLKVAQAMLQSGYCHTALICSADFISDKFYSPLLRSLQSQGSLGAKLERWLPSSPRLQLSLPRTSEIMNALTFGDGAGALVLKRSDESKSPGLDLNYLNVTSRFTDLKTGFNLNHGKPKHDHRAMKLALPQVVSVLRDELLECVGTTDNIDLLIVPQANSALMGIINAHPLDDKQFYIGNETGNSPSAAIFRAMDIAKKRGRLIPDQTRVGITAVESASWIYAVGHLAGRQQ